MTSEFGMASFFTDTLEDAAMFGPLHQETPQSSTQPPGQSCNTSQQSNVQSGRAQRSHRVTTSSPLSYPDRQDEASGQVYMGIPDNGPSRQTSRQKTISCHHGNRYGEFVAQERAGPRRSSRSTAPSTVHSAALGSQALPVQGRTSSDTRQVHHRPRRTRREEDTILRDAAAWPTAEDMDDPVSSPDLWTSSSSRAPSTLNEVAQVQDHTLQWLDSQAKTIPATLASEVEVPNVEPQSSTRGSWSPQAEAFLNEDMDTVTQWSYSPISTVSLTPQSGGGKDHAIATLKSTISSDIDIADSEFEDEEGLISDETFSSAKTGTSDKDAKVPQAVRQPFSTSSVRDARAATIRAATDAVNATQPATGVMSQDELFAEESKGERKASGWVIVDEIHPLNNSDDFDLTEVLGPEEAELLSSQDVRSWWPLAGWLRRRKYRLHDNREQTTTTM